MKEIFFSFTTDDKLSSVKSTIDDLVAECLDSKASITIFDNGNNKEIVAHIFSRIKEKSGAEVTLFSGHDQVQPESNVTLHLPTVSDLHKMRLPAQFIMLVGSNSYVMLRGNEWRGYQNQPEATRLAMETLSRIRRLFF